MAVVPLHVVPDHLQVLRLLFVVEFGEELLLDLFDVRQVLRLRCGGMDLWIGGCDRI